MNRAASAKTQKKGIRRENTKVDAILSSIGEGLLVTDTRAKITAMNSAAEHILGRTLAESAGKFIWDVTRTQYPSGTLNPADHRLALQVIKTGNRLTTSEFYFEKKDKTKFPVETTITPIFANKKIVGTVQVFRDISLEKEVDKAKTEFISLTSHQLRTPLTAIKLFLEILENESVGALNPVQREYIDDLRQSTDRMIRLVNNLLNVSRLEAGKLLIAPESTIFTGMIDGVISELASWIKAKNCDFSFEKPIQPIPAIPLDPALTRQIVINLISNAVKYAKPGQGKVTVKLEKRTDGYLFSVTDNGIGIAAATKEKIFSKFFRADNAIHIDTAGSGLGLYIIKMIVEAGGGKIWFESDEGKGSTFYVLIPPNGMKANRGETKLTL